jgi:hypothetical protein
VPEVSGENAHNRGKHSENKSESEVQYASYRCRLQNSERFQLSHLVSLPLFALSRLNQPEVQMREYHK